MKAEFTKQDYQHEALNQFKSVTTLLAGFSFASMTFLMSRYQATPLYKVGFACICAASISLICAATLSAMLASAVKFEGLDTQPLRWVSQLLGVLGFGGIFLCLVALTTLSFSVSMLTGAITGALVLILGGITVRAFFALNKHFSDT